MSVIQKKIESLDGYLFSIKRDTENGWYYLEVGLPKSWIFRGNDIINCKKINEWDEGNLIQIEPNENNVTIDDLIKFTHIILKTNEKIIAKEKEFEEKITKIKEELNVERNEFFSELDSLRDKSFSAFDYKLNDAEATKNKKRGRPKGSKVKKTEEKQSLSTENDGKKTEEKQSLPSKEEDKKQETIVNNE